MPTTMPSPKPSAKLPAMPSPSINPSIYPSISQPRLNPSTTLKRSKPAVISVCPPHHPSAITRHLSQTFLLSNRSAIHTSTHTKPSRTAQRLGVPFFWYLDGGHLPHATSCQPSHSEKNQTLSLRHQPVWIDGRNTKPTAHTSQQPHTGAPAWIGDFRHPKLSIDTTTSL